MPPFLCRESVAPGRLPFLRERIAGFRRSPPLPTCSVPSFQIDAAPFVRRRNQPFNFYNYLSMNLPITISERDAARLRQLVQACAPSNPEHIQRLKAELDRARIVPGPELPANVIAMNSTVELEDLEDGEILTYTLVFPENADIAAGKISILAPLGMAMLGFKVGDEFEWPVPAGTLRVRVRRLIEPKSEPALLVQLRG